MEVKPSIFFGGKYPHSPLRHRSANKESLKDLSESLDYHTTNNPIDADIYLSVDYNIENEEILRERKASKKLNILFRNEPECVLPAGYSSLAIEVNDYILTFGKASDSPNDEFWPQFWEEGSITQDISQRIQDRAVLVNANKLNLSRSELYSLRRACIKKLNNVDLFGDEWNTPLRSRIKVALIEILKKPEQHLFTFSFHSRYWFTQWPLTLAPVDKSVVLNGYKVSLVIENEKKYLSEKLFDALTSGCIPVYVGPDITQYGIPNGLVFQAEPDLKSIKEQLDRAFKADYQNFQAELISWLQSPKTKDRHYGENVMKRALTNCAEYYSLHSKKDKI